MRLCDPARRETSFFALSVKLPPVVAAPLNTFERWAYAAAALRCLRRLRGSRSAPAAARDPMRRAPGPDAGPEAVQLEKFDAAVYWQHQQEPEGPNPWSEAEEAEEREELEGP